MSRSPNVLLICVDHWPANLLGAAGHAHILTPTLDQLSANGVRYSCAYSTTPICIPARRALMTGTTARTHGDRVFREWEPMPGDLPTMPAVFRAAGYQAQAVGKRDMVESCGLKGKKAHRGVKTKPPLNERHRMEGTLWMMSGRSWTEIQARAGK